MFRVTDIMVTTQRQYRRYDKNAIDNAFKEVVEKGTSVYKAARMFSIPEQTLRDRVSAKIALSTTKSGPAPLFDQHQEAQLSQHVSFMASIGYGYTRAEVLSVATDFAISLGLKTSQEKALSMRWFYGFLGRWPDLKVRKPKSLSELRAYATSGEKVEQYFLELDKILSKYELKSRPELIYNVDEKGIQLSQTPPYVVGSSTSMEICPEKSSIVTLMGCGNALGNQIPPYFIFKGARMRDELLTGSTPGTSGTVSETGWSNSTIFESYLKDHFLRYASGRKEEKILLLYDGHRSHISPNLIEWANVHDIILFVLPPHTSHVLQPMDVGCFGPFSKVFLNECHKWQRLNSGTVNKYNLCSLACKAYGVALSPNNLRSSFRKCGIHPFDPSAIDTLYLRPSTFAKSCQENEERIPVVDELNDSNVEPTQSTPVPPDDNASSFFADRLPVLAPRKRSERRSINKVVGGKAITESDVSTKVANYLEESTNKNRKRKRSSISKKLSSDVSDDKTQQNNNQTQENNLKQNQTRVKKTKVKKVTTKTSTARVSSSPQTGPSGLDTLLISDDELLSDDEILDDEKCCKCNRFQPVELQRCLSVVFTKWGQCMFAGCNHWVHLKYCCDVTVLRRHDMFYCPCHGLPCRQEE